MDKNQETFGFRLTTLMRERGLSVGVLARLIGVPPSTLQNWRSNSHPQDFHAIKRLAYVLGTSMEFLLTGEHMDDRGYPRNGKIFVEGEEVFSGYVKLNITKLIPRIDTEE